MDHISDFTKDEEQIILDLINFDNATFFTKEMITLGDPRNNGATTDLTVTPVLGTGYGGTVDVTYRRLQIQSFMDLYFPGGITLQQGDAVNISDLLGDINTALGIAIPADAIVDEPIGAWEGLPNEIKDLKLTMKPTNRVYIGSGNFKLDGDDITLSSVITQKILTGLNLPAMGVPIESIFKSNVLNGF